MNLHQNQKNEIEAVFITLIQQTIN